MRIVHAADLQIRRFGLTTVTTGRKNFYGLIRNIYQLLEFGDRDIAKFGSVFKSQDLGGGHANKRLTETYVNYQPD